MFIYLVKRRHLLFRKEGVTPPGRGRYFTGAKRRTRAKLLGQSEDKVLAAHHPSMIEYRDTFDTVKVNLAAMCEAGATGGKWSIMDKRTSIGNDARPPGRYQTKTRDATQNV